jgi:sarcosine oxidase subunit beta
LASEASGANGGGAGGLGAGQHQNLEKYRFSQLRELGRQIYSGLSDELGVDIEYCHSGGLILIRPQEYDTYHRIFDHQIQGGFNNRLLTAREAREIEPELKGEIGGAVYVPDRAHINPFLVVQGYCEAALRKYNLKVYTHSNVRGVRLFGRKVEAIETDGGVISTKIIVNAAGAWAPRIGAMVGCEIPIVPWRGIVFVTQSLPRRLNQFIGVAEPTVARYNFETMEDRDTPDYPSIVDGQVKYRALYGRQTTGGQILFGGRSEFVGLNKTVTLKGVTRIMAHTLEFFPGFEDLQIVRTWAGIMPFTPDGKPILGPVPSLDGFYLATGLCGGGLGTGSVLGQLMANLINHGERPGLFDDTSITRFAGS